MASWSRFGSIAHNYPRSQPGIELPILRGSIAHNYPAGAAILRGLVRPPWGNAFALLVVIGSLQLWTLFNWIREEQAVKNNRKTPISEEHAQSSQRYLSHLVCI